MSTDEVLRRAEAYFEREAELARTFSLADPEPFNALREAMLADHMDPRMRLSHAERTERWSDEVLERYQKVPFRKTRREVCKLSRYEHQAYPLLCAVHATATGLMGLPTRGLGACHWWAESPEGKLGIVADYTFDFRVPEENWFFHSGDPSIGFGPERSGAPVEIQRLLPPGTDPRSLEDYLSDI